MFPRLERLRTTAGEEGKATSGSAEVEMGPLVALVSNTLENCGVIVGAPLGVPPLPLGMPSPR